MMVIYISIRWRAEVWTGLSVSICWPVIFKTANKQVFDSKPECECVCDVLCRTAPVSLSRWGAVHLGRSCLCVCCVEALVDPKLIMVSCDLFCQFGLTYPDFSTLVKTQPGGAVVTLRCLQKNTGAVHAAILVCCCSCSLLIGGMKTQAPVVKSQQILQEHCEAPNSYQSNDEGLSHHIHKISVDRDVRHGWKLHLDRLWRFPH